MGNAYNPGERYLAKFLSKFPQVKANLKKVYQALNLLLYKKKYTYKSDKAINQVASDGETFFGYYDKSPLSANNRYLLYNESIHPTNSYPDASKPIQIKVLDIQQNKIIHTSSTFSYNWQQGARAQWLSSSSYIFNSYNIEDNYHSIIVDLNTEHTTKIASPVYDCYFNEYALTLNFSRLTALRPDYGYRNSKAMSDNAIADLNNDGVFKIDLITGDSSLLISLQALKKHHTEHNMENALHKVNHIMISPDGERFIFLHRYYVNKRRFDRLFVADKNGGNLRLLAADEMVSHFCWIDNKSIVVYLRDKLLGDKYYNVDVESGVKEVVGKGLIDNFGDGHPTVCKNKMVFDTYPNKARMKELFVFDLSTHSLEKLGEFYEGLQYSGEWRCDLHPRFSLDGTKIFIDSVHTGKRNLYWLEV
ncbi:glycosyl transferase [Inquilinus sp. KBS0705]|nr:glycosyl transferase [Inquilinus sp. KBS0705]